ncbi:MAG TPA: poly-gamma-glutamate biosynthesis protein, partial [Kiloniellaceae bacterium]|nr:poly-gamma-glutamate biosynthesis protein [Kiloniellaceae bacterium]
MTRDERSAGRGAVTLFLCGDVMTGRGIDQVLPHPVHPRLYEPYVRSAVDYVTLAERENGPIPRGVAFDYVWGDALTELGRIAPDLRIINLETAVTTSETPWPRKGIHYRMHPRNIPCLNAAGIDACVLANNHVLDWGRAGLEETLTTLRQAGVETVGAGGDLASASAPRVLGFSGGGRLLVYACAHPSSGVPPGWEAGAGRPGVSLLGAFSPEAVERIGR